MSANKARAVFVELVANVPPEEWEGRLDQLAGGDAELRRKVAGLLAVHLRGDHFLEKPAPALEGTVAEAPTPVSCGEQRATGISPAEGAALLAGRYKLLELIGEGGMGAVWMAQQQEPVKRLVAVKLIKLGMDSRQVLARFQAERQALALMDHPHIAKVLDGGAAPDGRPFFVMELVKGVPLTRYCDEHQLTPRQRLELFVSVCRAVQHAHQKGIIHRDLKPSNVLVAPYDGRPVPKVIDFGVAKAAGDVLTDRTLFTGFGTVVGTPEYMSPEQAELNNQDIDTRSDVYSLGVLLYELLTGTTPISRKRVKEGPLLEVLRLVREEEPPRPSTRLSTTAQLPAIAARRGLEPKKLRRLIRGELDWIVMKCLEKDRSRRYETANGLALDIQRYLADEPVLACPPSAGYRLRKLVRRNRAAVAVAALVAALLLVATAVSTALAVWATGAERLAKQRLESETAARQQAVAAEGRATQRLYDSLVAGAQASRWSGRAGQRFKSLEALAEASRLVRSLDLGSDALGEEILKLRNEAVAAITLTDLKLAREWDALPPSQSPIAVAFDGDMARYAFADADGNVRVHRCADDAELVRLPGFHTPATVARFSPDGQLLAVAYPRKNRLRVWDLKRREVRVSAPYAGYAVAFRPGGRQVAVTAPDGALGLFDLATGKEQNRLSVDLVAATASFHPDGKRLVVGGWNHAEAHLIDVDGGQVLARLPHPDGLGVVASAWHPDGRLLATACGDQIYLWEPETNTGKPRTVLEGHQARVTQLAFERTGRLLASNGYDATLRIWDPWLARQLVSMPGGEVPPTWDGRLPYRSDLRRVGILELAASQECGVLRAQRTMPAFSPDGRLLAAPDQDGVHLVDAASCIEAAFLATGPTDSVAFDPAGGDLLTCGEAGLQRWPLTPRTGAPGCWRVGAPQPLPCPTRGLRYLATSRDGRTLVLRGNGVARALVFRTDRPGPCVLLQGPPCSFWSAAVSPDGRWVADGPWNGRGVRVWDTTTGKLCLQLPGTDSVTRAYVAFSPDGRWLAVGGRYEFRLWKVGTWEPGLRLPQGGPGGLPRGVAFSPDGAVLALVHSQRLVKLVEVSTGVELVSLPTPQAEMQQNLCFSPDGTRLVVTDERKPLHIWELRRVRERLEGMGLDWPQPAYSPAPPEAAAPLRVEVDAAPAPKAKKDK